MDLFSFFKLYISFEMHPVFDINLLNSFFRKSLAFDAAVALRRSEMATLAVLIFAAFLPLVQLEASRKCSIVATPTSRASDPNFCIREATVRRALSLEVFGNGTCRMIVNCVGPSNPCCSVFVRVVQPHQDLLLRTRVERNTNPYHLFKNLIINGSVIDAHTRLNTSDPFMSPLILLKPSPFSHVRVQMLTGRVASPLELRAELRFRIEEHELIPNGTWFSKSRLVASTPWNVAKMRSQSYRYFSIEGRKTRRFYLSENNDGCRLTAGYMLTTDAHGSCSWEKYRETLFGEIKWPYGRYMWAVSEDEDNDKIYGIWKDEFHDADEFRLVGDVRTNYDKIVKVYLPT